MRPFLLAGLGMLTACHAPDAAVAPVEITEGVDPLNFGRIGDNTPTVGSVFCLSYLVAGKDRKLFINPLATVYDKKSASCKMLIRHDAEGFVLIGMRDKIYLDSEMESWEGHNAYPIVKVMLIPGIWEQ